MTIVSDANIWLEIIKYCVPAVLTAVIAFCGIWWTQNNYSKQQEKAREFDLEKIKMTFEHEDEKLKNEKRERICTLLNEVYADLFQFTDACYMIASNISMSKRHIDIAMNYEAFFIEYTRKESLLCGLIFPNQIGSPEQFDSLVTIQRKLMDQCKGFVGMSLERQTYANPEYSLKIKKLMDDLFPAYQKCQSSI